jgi:hypothetical protein
VGGAQVAGPVVRVIEIPGGSRLDEVAAAGALNHLGRDERLQPTPRRLMRCPVPRRDVERRGDSPKNRLAHWTKDEAVTAFRRLLSSDACHALREPPPQQRRRYQRFEKASLGRGGSKLAHLRKWTVSAYRMHRVLPLSVVHLARARHRACFPHVPPSSLSVGSSSRQRAWRVSTDWTRTGVRHVKDAVGATVFEPPNCVPRAHVELGARMCHRRLSCDEQGDRNTKQQSPPLLPSAEFSACRPSARSQTRAGRGLPLAPSAFALTVI